MKDKQIKKKGRGGKRPGSGRPLPHPEKGKKIRVALSLYPDDKEYLIDTYGSVQTAVEMLLPDENTTKNK